MKKVLITGGAGFIGYALSKELLKRDYEVDVIDNLSIGNEAKISPYVNFLNGDIRAMDNIKNKAYDYIFHLAALSRIQPSFQNPYTTFSINVDGTKKVVENERQVVKKGDNKHENKHIAFIKEKAANKSTSARRIEVSGKDSSGKPFKRSVFLCPSQLDHLEIVRQGLAQIKK